jgi:NAD(P)-dependent dehydrogenase (short-subunit alcohol dehydrogenase family)
MAGKAIITGSDSGIGKASAVALARAGFDVGVTWNTDEDGARDTAKEVRGVGGTAAVRRLDVSDFAAAAYCAAKGGLGLLTKVMALELGEHGITVNSIAPGEIATPMTEAHDVDPSTEDRPALPLGRPGNAHEIAATVAHLASPDARYTTGSSLVVDGGLMLTAAKFNQVLAGD